MNNKDEGRKAVNVLVPISVYNQLKDRAYDKRMRISEYVREILSNELKKAKP